METVSFKVKGSASEPYVVTFVKDGGNLSTSCTCPAGTFRQYCKHRFAILAGIADGIVSENAADVAVIKRWLAGTDVQSAMQELVAAQAAYDEAGRKLSAAKKKVARALAD
jgi:uncharacterized Zn finger protein